MNFVEQITAVFFTRRRAVALSGFLLAILLAVVPVFAQNGKSSRGSAGKQTANKKRMTTKKQTRPRKNESSNQSGVVNISGAKPIKPLSTDTNVRDMPQIGPTETEREQQEELERLPPPAQEKKPLPGAIEPPVVDSIQPSSPSTPTPLANFDGLDFTSWGSGFPPDTVGDVGPNHYVQAVNSAFAVYNKTGTRLTAVTFNNFWGTVATGTQCAGSHRGDPTVVYDPQHDRWVVADFAFAGGGTAVPFYECVAVSKTADPTGAYWLYAIRTDDAAHPWFSDYPKMGVWHDGLYMTVNMFNSALSFQESRVWAFNLTDMIAGASLRSVVIDLNTSSEFSLLPGNYRGTLPPASREELVIGESQTAFGFNVYKFKPNYTTPASSTFTGPTVVSQASYTAPAGSNPSPANGLDTVQGDNLKMQAQYRNIGGTESLWVSHSAGTTPNSIQWAQINVTGGTINTTPVQQQIYGNLSSDGLYRWIPSLAVDRQGNMMLGYSASSASVFPSIRYNGRLATDTPNTLPQGEVVLQAGSGSESGSCNGTCTRWGDYSTMSVDPSDDCTFWYSTLYFSTSGLAWRTRIGAVKFTQCQVSPPGHTRFDFDGDAKADISIFRPAAGQWWILKSSNGGNTVFQFGTGTDRIVPADYTGDGKADVAVFRPSNGTWYIQRSEDNSFYSFPFGANGDIPAPADYDGDGKEDAAVFRPSTVTWYIFRSSDGGTTITQFGANGDIPTPANYDGDAKADIAVYRPSTGVWWIQKSTGSTVAYQFGNSTDKPVPGDYTGDGKADAAFWRPSTGEWFVLRSETQTYYSFPFGVSTDTPAPADFDGDGKFDQAIFRPSSVTWYISKSTGGSTITAFGAATDRPVENAFIP
jgi:hypothetical protein